MGEPLLRGWYAIRNTVTGEWLSTTQRQGTGTHYTFSSERRDAIWYRTRAQVLIVLGKLRRRSKKDKRGPTGPFVIVKDDTRITAQGLKKRLAPGRATPTDTSTRPAGNTGTRAQTRVASVEEGA